MDGMGMEWNGVVEGKGERKWEGGEVGRYYGGRGEDGRMGGWAGGEDVGDRGLSGVEC